ncbi:hypothetical protein E4U41_005558, partial [Claviceps citrina]
LFDLDIRHLEKLLSLSGSCRRPSLPNPIPRPRIQRRRQRPRHPRRRHSRQPHLPRRQTLILGVKVLRATGPPSSRAWSLCTRTFRSGCASVRAASAEGSSPG